MKIHFISIGGSVMHNMAIAMQEQGHIVSGSDDEIFEPALSRLNAKHILPVKLGWFPEKITADIDMIILGMHARIDNPELLKAQELRLKIVSFPEFVYLNSQDKMRIVVAGSHGKTTITSMIMHVFRDCKKDFDYLVGSSVDGFENSFKITSSATSIIIEGDEYLSSAVNPEPKFLWYRPHIAVISGIAWDHANVFPTYDIYRNQFEKFIGSLPDNARLVYCADDRDLCEMVKNYKHIHKEEYGYPDYTTDNSIFYLNTGSNRKIALKVNGSHNLMNIEAARMVCMNSGIAEDDFYNSIKDFKGAGKRLEKIAENEKLIIFRDFAHAPSKVRATIEGVKMQFPDKKIFAFFELHTYSSLNSDFMPQYADSMNMAHLACVFISEKAIEIKKARMPEDTFVRESFNNPELQIIHSKAQLIGTIESVRNQEGVLLLMSSGNFDGINNEMITEILM